MAQVSHAAREIKLKVVYYGPALSGKTTNLVHVHQSLFPNQRVKLFSINTGDDRTLFFDLLPLDLGEVNGYTLKLQLFTVPGQVHFEQTRRAVLTGADGIVFVADSRAGTFEENAESFADLCRNLESNQIDPDTIPMILQYNKQDAPEAMPAHELDALLNLRQVPVVLAVAIEGRGVLTTLQAAILATLENFGLQFDTFPLDELKERVRRSLEAAEGNRKPALPDNSQSTQKIRLEASGEDSSKADLFEKALLSSVELAELYNDLNATKESLEQKNRELTVLSQINQTLTESFAPENLPAMLFKSILLTFQTSAGSILEKRLNTKRLYPLLVSSFEEDPLIRIQIGPGVNLAQYLSDQDRPMGFSVLDPKTESFPGISSHQLCEQIKAMNLVSFLCVPLRASGLTFGLLNIYQQPGEGEALHLFGNRELQFLIRLATPMALALEKHVRYRRARQTGEELTREIMEKTGPLRQRIHVLREENLNLRRRAIIRDLMLEPLAVRVRRQEKLFHDFRSGASNALASILDALTRYDQIPGDIEGLEQFEETILAEATTLKRLLSPFGTFSSHYLDTTQPDMQEFFPVEHLLTSIRELYRPPVSQAGLAWEESIPQAVPLLTGRPDDYLFVLSQLLEFAMRGQSEGTVRIVVHPIQDPHHPFVKIGIRAPFPDVSPTTLQTWFDHLPAPAEAEELPGQVLQRIGLRLCGEVVQRGGGTIHAKGDGNTAEAVLFEIPAHLTP